MGNLSGIDSPTARLGLLNRIFRKYGTVQDQLVPQTADQPASCSACDTYACTTKCCRQHATPGVQQGGVQQQYGCNSDLPQSQDAMSAISISKSASQDAIFTANSELCNTSTDNARDSALLEPGLQHRHQQSAASMYIDGMAPPVGQRSSNGSINEPGASVWLHEAFAKPHSSCSSPSPMQCSITSVKSGGKFCASMEDMYKMIFDDGPSTSAANSPCPTGSLPTRQGSVASVGSFSSLQQHIGCNYDSFTASGAARVTVDGNLNVGYCHLDDLVPTGLPKLKISHDTPDGDVDDTGTYLGHSPGCSSSGSIPVPAGCSTAAAVSSGNSYHDLQTERRSSAPNQSVQQRPHLKRLWDRRQAGLSTGNAGSKSAASSPTLHGIGGGVLRTFSSNAGPESLLELAARLGHGSPNAVGSTLYGSQSSCSATPLSHSYSTPDMTSSPLPPACARSLFGSIPQMDRPLGSSSWLARSDSGFIDDHLSVASDDEYIREVNSENILSSAWGPGPQHTKLMGFKYFDATSPLNHPGRASPFQGSPFASPRGSSRDAEMLPLRTAVSACAMSCPGSPLASNYSAYNSDSASAALHRHPFGRALHDASSSYRPSPLQQQQQCCYQAGQTLRQRTSSSDLSVSHVACQDDACATEGGSDSVTLHQQSNIEDAVACQEADGPGRCLPTAHSEVGSVVRLVQPGPQAGWAETRTDEGRHQSCSSARRPSSVSGHNGAMPAASVAALMAGWGGKAAASPGASWSASSTPVRRRYGLSQQGGQTASPVKAPHLHGSGSCSPAEAVQHNTVLSRRSEFSKPAGVAAAAAAVAADAGGCCTPASSSKGSRHVINRSRSMPVPAKVSSSTVTPHSATTHRTAIGTLMSCFSGPGGGVMRQLTTGSAASISGLFPSLSSSSELLLPPPKPHGADSIGWRCGRRNSRGHSSSSFTNPSRLSQSSAAGTSMGDMTAVMSTRVQATRSSSNGSSLLDGVGEPAACAPEAAPAHGHDHAVGSPQPEQGYVVHGLAAMEDSIQPALGSPHSAASATPANMTSRNAGEAVPLIGHATPHASRVTSCTAIEREKSVHHDTCSNSCSSSSSSSSIEASDLDLVWAQSNSVTAAQDSCTLDGLLQPATAMPSLPEVDFIDRIGRGSYGEVYRGVWCGSVVAVKVIKVRQRQQSQVHILKAAQPDDQQSAVAALVGLSSHSSVDVSSCSCSTQQHAQDGAEQLDEQDQQVALELAQHEYESWLNANLRHPNIVQLFTSFTVVLEDRPCAHPATAMSAAFSGLSWKTHLVMEFCELGTMQSGLQRGMFMDPHSPDHCNVLWVLATAKELCAALAYLHSMDVVHGDLKSSNVLLKAAATTAWDSRGFVAKVSDFGLSRVMDAISAANGTTNGSSAAASTCTDALPASSGAPLGQWQAQPHFGALSHAAPELIKGKELSKASDVYSVGVLLWELVTGQAPFYGMHPGQLLNAKLTSPTSQLLQFSSTAPPAIEALCVSCWAEDPMQRPTMKGIVERLNGMAVELLGEEQAITAFPDIARAIFAQRRIAAATTAAAAIQGSS